MGVLFEITTDPMDGFAIPLRAHHAHEQLKMHSETGLNSSWFDVDSDPVLFQCIV